VKRLKQDSYSIKFISQNLKFYTSGNCADFWLNSISFKNSEEKTIFPGKFRPDPALTPTKITTLLLNGNSSLKLTVKMFLENSTGNPEMLVV